MPLILGTNSIKDTGFNVDNSLRFNSGSSDYLQWNSSPSGNRQKFTYSVWFKRSSVGNTQILASASYSSGDEGYLFLSGGGALGWQSTLGGDGNISTSRKFRDFSAWYHLVWSVDTTQATASNRMKFYINGVQETSFSSETYPNQNQNLYWNVGGTYYPYIGRRAGGDYFNGYMAEVVHINNQQLDATSFGEFDSDTGIWKPIDVSELTFGTTGYYLDFEDSSALGNDVSGNDNDFTVNNLTAIDQCTDTCTNNFATLNPLAPMDTSASVQTLSEGNLKAVPSSGWNPVYATIPLSLGKWYIEVLVTQVSGNEVVIGLNPDNFSNTSDTAHSNSGSGVWYQSNGLKWISGSNSSYGASYDDGDIISVLINIDDSEVTFYKNDASQGTISFNTNLTAASSIIFGLNGIETTSITQTNFGSPSFSISSGNTDGNGYGNFEYAVPSGYYSLNTKNLAKYG